MFGYIRPLQGELKVCELERFKARYCGLCHALGKRYGLAARFTLSYELVFLSMLICSPGEATDTKRGRCIASPCKKKPYCAQSPALDTCAGYNVILAWWKLRDTITDESFLRSLPHRLASRFLSAAYRKAAENFPEFDGTVSAGLASLAGYCSQGSDSLDGAADNFAKILTAAVPGAMTSNDSRPLTELLYHTGRWIYLIDAYDDLRDDAKAGRYNPVAVRFKAIDGKLADEISDRLKTTITHSNTLICAAFELLPENIWSETVRNIIYLGMPEVCALVFNGGWPVKRQKN